MTHLWDDIFQKGYQRTPTSDTQQRSKNKSQNHNMMSDTINICFVFDEKFVDLFKVSILSIAKNTNSTLSVYIIDCGISKDGKSSIVELTNRLKNIESITFGIPARISEIENFKIPAYFSSSVFYRLAIPKTFPELQRAIYLDCDIIAIRDIRELWNEDLHGRPIGIVEEKGTFFLPDWEEKHKNIINAPSDHTCIYSGVLLIDCTKFEKVRYLSALLMSSILQKYTSLAQNRMQ